MQEYTKNSKKRPERKQKLLVVDVYSHLAITRLS